MRNLSDTLTRLASFRDARTHAGPGGEPGHLQNLPEFGSNPGALRGSTFIPADLPGDAPLVVVLHGCTQTAGEYDRGSGWSDLADRHGFALLYPEQQKSNNAQLCFNWFQPGDTARDAGEALSIRQMIERVVIDHGIDRCRIFITGLSAGGAMTSVMLATYPEVFAGGAIIAGLPFGCAASVPEAFDRMRGHGIPAERQLQAKLRQAAAPPARWPTISVWHGTADHTVSPANAEAIIAQWRAAHGAAPQPTRTETIDGFPKRVWTDTDGRDPIEEYLITGMGHGTPLDTSGTDGCGARGPFMLDVGISSTRHLARSWGLAEAARVLRAATAAAPRPTSETVAPAHPIAGRVGAVIEDALRAAGLMR